ncbi:hypothetical protein AAC387_Pa01g0935 [Persea americana]
MRQVFNILILSIKVLHAIMVRVRGGEQVWCLTSERSIHFNFPLQNPVIWVSENPVQIMAGTGSSMLYSFLLFIIVLSLQEMYRAKLASSELFTILGGLISSLIFLVLLTFIGNFQESCGMRTGWGAVLLAESVALVAASTVHRVCITTCFLFSAGLLYEVNKLSGMMLQKNEAKVKRH